MRFNGMNRHNLDKQNRLFIPAKMREELGKKFVLFQAVNGDRCLYIYSVETWEKLADEIDNQPPSPELTMQQRIFANNSDTVETDPQGRITIKPDFVAFAGLEGESLITGAGHRIEIWNPKEHEKMLEKGKNITFNLRL